MEIRKVVCVCPREGVHEGKGGRKAVRERVRGCRSPSDVEVRELFAT